MQWTLHNGEFNFFRFANVQNFIVILTEPRRPLIDVPKTGEDIPVGDGSPVMMNVGDNVTAPSNTTVTIRCPVSGVPTPRVTWKKNGVEIEEKRKTNIAADNSLVFQSAEVQDSAKYTCTAQNKFGKDVVSSVVGIVGKPSFFLYAVRNRFSNKA